MHITKSGTKIIDGIEFNESPPSSLKRATTKKWATALFQKGSIRMNSLNHLRKLEDSQRGDENEGKGLYLLNGHPMRTGSVNEVFAWCTCRDTVRDEDLLRMFEGTDTIVRISDPMELARRIIRVFKLLPWRLYLHSGRVRYTRGKSVTKHTLNNQLWHFNIFQKEGRFKPQREYRFSLTNVGRKRIDEDHLDLELGYCGDIISII